MKEVSMKKQLENSKKEDYTYIEKNIYKTGKSYRVRVGKYSENGTSLTQARKIRKRLKEFSKSSWSW